MLVLSPHQRGWSSSFWSSIFSYIIYIFDWHHLSFDEDFEMVSFPGFSSRFLEIRMQLYARKLEFFLNYSTYLTITVFSRIDEEIRIHPRFASQLRLKRSTAAERRQTKYDDCWEQFGSLGHDVASTLCDDLLFDL